MGIRVSDVYKFIDEIAPFSTQEDWDNSGILIGGMDCEVSRIAVCLDVTHDTIDKALEFGAQLIISHHPVIWEPLKFVPYGSPVSRAIREGLSIICAHTNWDLADGGVNDVLASMVGLLNITKVADEGELSMLRVGELKIPVPAEEFAEIVSESLETVTRVSSPDKKIKTVAVCGGSGASFLPLLVSKGIDAFLTGDAKHNDFLDAADLGISLLAAGHYETETISMPIMLKLLKREFPNIEYEYIESAPVVYIG